MYNLVDIFWLLGNTFFFKLSFRLRQSGASVCKSAYREIFGQFRNEQLIHSNFLTLYTCTPFVIWVVIGQEDQTGNLLCVMYNRISQLASPSVSDRNSLIPKPEGWIPQLEHSSEWSYDFFFPLLTYTCYGDGSDHYYVRFLRFTG